MSAIPWRRCLRKIPHWRSTPWTLSKSNTKSCPRLRILKKRLRPVLSRFTRAAWRARNCAARFMARRKDSRGRTFVITSASVGAISIKGFAESDFVFEDTFRFQKVQHYSLEAHINIAYYDGEKLTMWSSCQDPFTLRDHLSGIFRLPLSRVRVIVPYVGGGYGGKLYVKGEPIAAALSWKTRRPVKLSFSVNESFKTVTRHPARVMVKTGVKKDGSLVARECQIYLDTGAYADAGPRVTQKAGYRSLGPYKIPYAKVEAHGVYTNTVPAGAFRGFGALQVTWAYESQMDMIADRLGIDPLDYAPEEFAQEGRSLHRRRYTGRLRPPRRPPQSRRRHSMEKQDHRAEPGQGPQLLHERMPAKPTKLPARQ